MSYYKQKHQFAEKVYVFSECVCVVVMIEIVVVIIVLVNE